MKHKCRRRDRPSRRQDKRTDRDALKEDIMKHFYKSIDAGYDAREFRYTPWPVRKERAIQHQLREQQEKKQWSPDIPRPQHQNLNSQPG